MRRRDFLSSTVWAGSLGIALGRSLPGQDGGMTYDEIRWLPESEDPSISLETENLVAKVIDNSGLRTSNTDPWNDPGYSHHLGYHGIRSLWDKNEKRNIVAPFVSWLNLQNLSVGSLPLDPVDSRARFGVGRGWPITMTQRSDLVELKTPRMPRSGIQYELQIRPSGPHSFDFKVQFLLHKRPETGRTSFQASWPCYMSTYDEVSLWAPRGNPESPEWVEFGEKEPFVVGEAVRYEHQQRAFFPRHSLAFSAVFGRIGPRVWILMTDSTDVNFFLVNAGGHRPFFATQNPAWDFSFETPDYEVGVPLGFRGRIIYKQWDGTGDVLAQHQQWRRDLASADSSGAIIEEDRSEPRETPAIPTPRDLSDDLPT